MSARKHFTEGCVAQLCHSWLSPGKATQSSHAENPDGTVTLFTSTVFSATSTLKGIRGETQKQVITPQANEVKGPTPEKQNSWQ